VKASLTQAGAVAAAAITILLYEVILGGARPQVLSAAVTLLLAPGAIRLDSLRRKKQDEDGAP
jgi:hypothetical protein